VRDNVLQQAVEAFTMDAAYQLALDASQGEEIPFELMETEGRRGRPPLYCYQPLTGQFIDQRLGALSGLTTYAPAVRALAGHDRLAAYLNLHGVSAVPEDARRRADDALRLLLGRVFAGRDDFEFDADRFASAYEELERTLLEGRCTLMVIAPVLGIAIDPTTPEIRLQDGLSLTSGDRVPDAPAEAVWGEVEEPNVLAVLTSSAERTTPASVAAVTQRFRELLTALRLFERGSYALGPMAWTRIDSGPWQPVALGAMAPPSSLTLVPARQEDELRGFCSLIPRRLPDDGEVVWALARFEMGCERVDPFQALTDYLLALRALLEPEGPTSGRLAQRLAMICAAPEHRAGLAERAARAVSMERAVIAGVAPGRAEAYALVDEMGDQLRALLRDTLCGHLDSDLVRVADGLLAAEAGGEAGGEVAPASEERRAFEADPDAAASGASASDADATSGFEPVSAAPVGPTEPDPEPFPDPDPVGAPA
jgi:hypothetical protein